MRVTTGNVRGGVSNTITSPKLQPNNPLWIGMGRVSPPVLGLSSRVKAHLRKGGLRCQLFPIIVGRGIII
jgi:hypothetical protein